MWKTGKQSSVWKTAEPRVMPWCWKFCRIFQSNANCSKWTPILWKIVWSNALKIAQPLKWQTKFCQYHTLLRQNGVISLKIHNHLSERERNSGVASIWKHNLTKCTYWLHCIESTHTQSLCHSDWVTYAAVIWGMKAIHLSTYIWYRTRDFIIIFRIFDTITASFGASVWHLYSGSL